MNEIQLIVLFLALFGIKHFLCDFLFQFSYMVAEKGTYGAKGGRDHAALHGIFTALVFWLFVPFAGAVILGVIDSVLHYHIDWAKQQLTRGLTPVDRSFWVWFGLDQGLHYLTYIMLIGWAVGAFTIN
jgi:hypothetical protein